MVNGRSLVALSFVVLLSGCLLNRISGSGNVITEPRSVEGFSAVSLGGSGRLIIEQTGSESLNITTDDNLLPHIKADVSGGTLTLGSKDAMTNISPSRDIVYKLTVKNLKTLNISGSGSADAHALHPDRLQISISGSGQVTAEGGAEDLKVDISGSGEYRGEKMQSQRATVEISGSGKALVASSERLDVEVSGSGTIEYMGNPQVNQHISGSGSVRKRQ